VNPAAMRARLAVTFAPCSEAIEPVAENVVVGGGSPRWSYGRTRARPRAQRRERGDHCAEDGARDGRARRSATRVRFIVGPTNVDKPDSRWITELQFVEVPEVLIPKKDVLSNTYLSATYDRTKTRAYDSLTPLLPPRRRFLPTRRAGPSPSASVSLRT